jgi:predicted AAA+ superfamily ATPase
MRRTGKTTLLNFIFDQIDSKNKIFIDLENPLNRKYFEEENYERIKISFEFLGIDFTHQSYIFLDEIQFVKNLPSVVKYLIDRYKVKFYLTGSASSI